MEQIRDASLWYVASERDVVGAVFRVEPFLKPRSRVRRSAGDYKPSPELGIAHKHLQQWFRILAAAPVAKCEYGPQAWRFAPQLLAEHSVRHVERAARSVAFGEGIHVSFEGEAHHIGSGYSATAELDSEPMDRREAVTRPPRVNRMRKVV